MTQYQFIQDDMLHEAIYKFKVMTPLLLPNIIDNYYAGETCIYEDYALLDYTLPIPLKLEEVMDQFEERMELIILYHLIPSEETEYGHVCCAYSNPSTERMFKIVARTNGSGLVSSVLVTIYDSLEVMFIDLKRDIDVNSKRGKFVYQREIGELVGDFS